MFFLLDLQKLVFVILPGLVEGPLEIAFSSFQVSFHEIIKWKQNRVV